jgi:hypothetical protein
MLQALAGSVGPTWLPANFSVAFCPFCRTQGSFYLQTRSNLEPQCHTENQEKPSVPFLGGGPAPPTPVAPSCPTTVAVPL